MMRALICMALILVAGCTPRPEYAVIPEAQGDIQSVFIGSTRGDGENGPGFERTQDLSFARVNVSIPAQHAPGRLEVRRRNPDPEQHFTLQQHLLFEDRSDFRDALRADLRQNNGEAVIFVHGYNTSFTETAFRAAQIHHDFEVPASLISYAWPSRGQPLAYGYDRDSALFARDGLEQLIREVKAAGASSILLVGHSLGGHLSMEALRQIAIASPAELHRLVDEVILISPDLDVELFRAQVARIGTLPQPFVVFVSERDGALALSAQLSGEENRLGNVSSVEQVADIDITVIDVSEFSQLSDLGHFTVGSSAALIDFLRNRDTLEQVIENDTTGNAGLVTGTILTIQDATEIVLLPASQRLRRK